MPLTKEQLLIQRYMCTGTPGKPLWPGYHHKHGDIITNVRQVWINTMANEAPHLFHPLQWGEGRQPEDMPEYILVDGVVFKVYDYDLYPNTSNGTSGLAWVRVDGKLNPIDLNRVTPATLEEYNDYQKQKQ